jgi:hypothetical protein
MHFQNQLNRKRKMPETNYLHFTDSTGLHPPGGWKYKSPHDGQWIPAEGAMPAIGALVEAVNRMERSNEYPLSSREQIEDSICRNIPPEMCRYANGGMSESSELCHMSGGEMLAGAKAVGKLIWQIYTGGDPWVDQAEAERRAAICVRCPKNIDASGCPGCYVMTEARSIIASQKGGKTTSIDQYLRQCCLCKCSISTIVHVKLDVLQTGMTEHQKKISPSQCWKLDLIK